MNRPECDDVLGYSIATGSVQDLATEIVDSLRSPQGRNRWLACINPHSHVLAQSKPRFKEALQSADWLLPDGIGIVFASRLLGGRIYRRVTGPELFSVLSTELNKRGRFSVLFVGAARSTLRTIARKYRIDYPNVQSLTIHSPPFRESFDDRELMKIRNVINRCEPDVLWVGLSAPKQELLLASLGRSAHYGFAAAIGAEFDFYAGKVRRAPPFFRRHSMEWLPRLLQEPARLWRRTFVSAPLFMLDVVVARMQKNRSMRS